MPGSGFARLFGFCDRINCDEYKWGNCLGFPLTFRNFKNFPEEDEPEVHAPDRNLPVLRWTKSAFQTLLTSTQMPPEYGATYPQEGDTAGDAPAGYVTMFADFFGDCSLRLSLTVFVVEVMEYYKLYISQLDPNVTGTIITENISIPKADKVDWFSRLRIIGWFKLDNRQLWVLRMMIGKMSRKARPVLREKNGDGLEEEAPLWRMFCRDFEGNVDIVKCGADEEGCNCTIVGNFRMPDEAALNAVLPGGKGASVGASRSTVGTKPVDDKKRKAAVVAGGEKVPRFRKKTQATAVPKPQTAVPKPQTAVPTGKNSGRTGLLVCRSSFFPESGGRESQKKGGESPSIEVVIGGGTPPSVHAEETSKKTAGETIVDTLDSSNNLIDPQEDCANQVEKPKSPEKTFGSTAAGIGGEDQPSIQPREGELEFYYRSYAAERGFDYHRPPWNVLQGDDVMNDPSACREILRGLGTPFEIARARGLPRQNQVKQLSSMLVGSSIIANAVMEDYNVLARREEETIRLRAEAEAMVKAAREDAKQLEKDKAAFEMLKQTERWAASASVEQVRSLAKLLSDECKGWREACDRENEKLFRVRQELNNLKAANTALVKEKVAAEATAREAETRGAKALEDADVDHTRLNKVVEDLQAEVQNRVTILEEVSSRATEAEAQARQAEEPEMGWPPL
ncbi:hypothetical protein Hanom_Chr02g00162221 [Helianthus anomalus]